MTAQSEFDVVFLGAGPGGYVAAIRAAQLGLKVAVVEKDRVGGTCLNRGCIPSKSYLRSAEIYRNTLEALKFGVIANDISLDFSLVQERKNNVVEQLLKGIEFLLEKNKVTLIKGFGFISGNNLSNRLVTIKKANNIIETISTKNIIIATGSRPKSLAGLKIDEKYIMTSDQAFEMINLPKSIIIVGGGVIGMEWASLLKDFGVEVTVVEFLPRILPLEDSDISKDMTRLMKKRKISIHTNTKVLPESIKIVNNQVELEAKKEENIIQLKAEKVLISIGREAVIDQIGIENLDIAIENGSIKVNEYYQTGEANIYAIGDCIGGLQLAHVASNEGIIAIEHIAGKNPKPLDYLSVPKCIFTYPEIASIGFSEDEARDRGDDIKVGKFQFRGIGKALVNGEIDGFIKIIIDTRSKTLIGVSMMGSHVTEMITEFALAKVIGATVSDIIHTIHPHPTLSEAIVEAVLDVDKMSIHS
ncbi:MAG: dihydrolipoyl dehydrogenase [Vulcanibacillus sp.]